MKKTAKNLAPVRASQLPATRTMLHAVRDELKSDITTLRLEIRASFKAMDARFVKMEARLSGMEARNERTLALYEEQNARNAYVMDHLTMLFDRQERIEKGHKP